MWQRLTIGVCGIGLICGCQSGSARRAPEHIDPDSASISDAPEPTIKPETFVAAGDLAIARNQPKQAAEQYAKALQIRPQDPPTLRKLALAHTKAGQTTAAIEAWQSYVTATGGSSDACGSLGYAYELAGNPEEAEKVYKDGVAKNPKGSLVRINYGLMLVRHNQVDLAVQQLSAVLQPHEVNYNIASIYEQTGRPDLAQFYYRRSLECNPQFAAAKQKLAALD
ncbi:MAG: tetratricopeptide repeat protein [Burkholderiales bacterium]|nr:tetratricopeptide repeat protein [Phycisphaerae bacterium]